MPLSRRSARLLLFAVLLATLPVPYYLGALEVAPALRLLFLAALASGVAATEGAVGNQLLLTLLAVGFAACWALALWGAAALLARLLERWAPPRARALLVGGLAAVLVAASMLPIYRTPLSSHTAESTVLGLFD